MLSSESYGLVDVHVHPPTKEFLIDAGGIHAEAAAKKFGHPIRLATFEEMLEEHYPMLSPKRWLDDFAALRVNSEIKRMILSENARRLLKIK